jgi:hypothetical protein
MASDLNEKYEQLLAKISKSKNVNGDEEDEKSSQSESNSGSNRDDRLKALYDASLQFKN